MLPLATFGIDRAALGPYYSHIESSGRRRNRKRALGPGIEA